MSTGYFLLDGGHIISVYIIDIIVKTFLILLGINCSIHYYKGFNGINMEEFVGDSNLAFSVYKVKLNQILVFRLQNLDSMVSFIVE